MSKQKLFQQDAIVQIQVDGSKYTGHYGEVTADLTIPGLRIHDGSTCGGIMFLTGLPVVNSEGLNTVATAAAAAAAQTVPIYEYRDISAESATPALADDTQWAFGSGQTGSIGLPFDAGWEVVALYFNSDVFPADGAIAVDLVNYGVTPSSGVENTVANIELTGPTDGGGVIDNAYKFTMLTTPVAVTAGVLGFVTRTASGIINDMRVGARLRRKVADAYGTAVVN